MLAGLQIINDAGTNIVSPENGLFAYHLLSKVSMTGGQSYSFTATAPVVAMPGAGSLLSNGGNSWTINSASGIAFIFDRHPTSAGGVGFEIYDGSGNIVLSSSTLPLRIVDVLASNDVQMLVGNHTYVAGNSYAGIVIAAGAKASGSVPTPSGPALYYYNQVAVSQIGGGINVSLSQGPGSMTSDQLQFFGAALIFVIDITGF